MYLAEIGAVDATKQQEKQDYFYRQYKSGGFDIHEFCEFQFPPLTQHSLQQLNTWHTDYMRHVIEPMIENGKAELLDKHRAKGDDIVIISATNDFVTKPIAKRLDVQILLATTAEFKNGASTGKIAGTPDDRLRAHAEKLHWQIID